MPKHPSTKGGNLLEEETVFHICNHSWSLHAAGRKQQTPVERGGEKEGNTGLQAHLSGRHIFEGNMTIG